MPSRSSSPPRSTSKIRKPRSVLTALDHSGCSLGACRYVNPSPNDRQSVKAFYRCFDRVNPRFHGNDMMPWLFVCRVYTGYKTGHIAPRNKNTWLPRADQVASTTKTSRRDNRSVNVAISLISLRASCGSRLGGLKQAKKTGWWHSVHQGRSHSALSRMN